LIDWQVIFCSFAVTWSEQITCVITCAGVKTANDTLHSSHSDSAFLTHWFKHAENWKLSATASDMSYCWI